MADGQFAKIKEKFVVARLDSSNADFRKALGIQRNTSYFLLMKRKGPNLLRKVVNPYYPMDEFARLTNPKDMKTIYGLIQLMNDSED